MRYKIIFLVFFLSLVLYSLSSVSAIPILKFQNNQTQPGETIFATITTSGEFTQQIEKSQIKFFEGRKEVTLDADILLYNKTHYLYIYTTKEENLTIQIENILYKEANILKSTTLIKNITIQKNILTNKETNETYTKILKVKPGFIFSTQTPEIRITNIGTSNLNITFNKEEISLPPLASQKIKFTPAKTFSLAKISTYEDFLVPVIYLISDRNVSFVSPMVKSDLRQDPKIMLAETFTKSKSKQIMKLFNFGENNLTNLKAISSLDFVEIEDLQNMSGKEIQNLTITLEPKTSGHFQGVINISYMQNGTEILLKIPLSIFVLPQGTNTTNETFHVKEKTCQELLGQVCDSGFICNGTATFTKNSEYCCMASCVQTDSEESKSGGIGWMVAIAIFVILGLIGYYFYKKQKLFQAPKPKDTLKATTEKFEKRLSGQSQRTTGNLTKS